MSRLKNNQEKEENILSSILFRFAPYWPLLLLLLIICGVGGWVYLRYATPMYFASSKILIKDEKKGVDDSKIVESFDIYTSKRIVENEIEVIKSRILMDQVVKRLLLYSPVYEKSEIKNKNAFISSPISIQLKEPDKINGADIPEKVYFKYDEISSKIKIANKDYTLDTWHETPHGILKFTKNLQAYKKPENDLYFLLIKPSIVVNDIVSRLSVKPTGKISTVLDLSITDESPDRAQSILNELMMVYAQSTIDEKNSLAANTLTFIEDRLRLVVKDLDSIERTIQQYKSKKGIVDLSEQGKVFLQNVGDNDRKVGDISMQLAALDQVENYVVSKNDNRGIVPSTMGLNDNLTHLLKRLYDAELDYSSLKQTMGENSPEVTSISKEIETIRPAILENVRNQRASLEASKRNISSTNDAYSSILRTIPRQERELLEISRQHAIKNNVYSFLLQKREETALSSSSSVADNRMIDAAQAFYTPVSPKKPIVYLAALALALVLSIGSVMAKEMLTGKILFRSNIEENTNIPIVGEIASVKHTNEIIIDQPGKAYITEQFRQLRVGMGLYKKMPTSKKKILITSSIAGEGKSFVAGNLAVSLAGSGKKVILIDADLRSPKTTKIFALENEYGLSEYLNGEIEISDVLYQSQIPNLFLLPAGGPTKKPTELLLNGKLTDFFSFLEKSFDYILIDTSPVDPVTDAYVLSEFCDKTIFVIRHAYTPKTFIHLLDESHKLKALPKLAIVFNGVKKRGFLKGNYGFGYGYGYEYIYKERPEIKRKIKTSLN